MKFQYLALVATASAAAVASKTKCGTDLLCTTATDACCAGALTSGGTVTADKYCMPKLTADDTTATSGLLSAPATPDANPALFFTMANCKGPVAAGAANLAATVAAAATALYAMC